MVTGGCISRFQSLIVNRADLQSRFVNTEPTAEYRFFFFFFFSSSFFLPAPEYRALVFVKSQLTQFVACFKDWFGVFFFFFFWGSFFLRPVHPPPPPPPPPAQLLNNFRCCFFPPSVFVCFCCYWKGGRGGRGVRQLESITESKSAQSRL